MACSLSLVLDLGKEDDVAGTGGGETDTLLSIAKQTVSKTTASS